MSDAMSNYMESGVLNFILRSNSNSFAAPSNVSVALLTNHDSNWGVDAKNGGTMPEVANANGYARVDLGAPANADWNEVSTGGATSNSSAINFPEATAHWGMVSGVALVTSATHGAGSILFHGALTTPRDVTSGDTFKFNAGDLDITLT
jgi:hypothetical protein|tara:strand:+ start:60 stop:506 length:447 start_codon:yes stop_codon:yes gene_type:complete